MKFKSALNEKTIPVASDKLIAKQLRQYRGINYIILDEGKPPDVHGIPKELEAYGRGWRDKKTGGLEIDGGAQGSSQGHPPTAEEGFYWGADYDKVWTFQGKQRKGVIYVRGRAGTSAAFLEKTIIQILELIFKRLPRP